jgi:UDP:flavonoid glycosyltransferase YjiC (YdhE family)
MLAPRWRNFSEDEVFGPLLNAYRSELGLPAVERICSHWIHSPQSGIALFPEWFWPRQSYWPDQITTTDFVSFDEPLTSADSPQLEEFLNTGTPPVVFTSGTTRLQTAEFFRESLAVCEVIGARALLLTRFPANIPHHLPPWALHVDYVPLRGILSRVSALVHPGGIGTCAQAIRAGVPQLVVPMVNDQFDNAQRIEALHLGVSVPMKNYSVEVIIDKLAYLFSSETIQQACRNFASRFAADNVEVTHKVCEIVERLGSVGEGGHTSDGSEHWAA